MDCPLFWGKVNVTGDSRVTVRGSASGNSATGGLVGRVGGSGRVSKSSALVIMTVNVVLTVTGNSYSYVGGLAGEISGSGSVSESYAGSTVTVTPSGSSATGGLVGRVGGSGSVSKSSVTSSSTVDVTGSGSSATGGLVGSSDGIISSSYAKGSVMASNGHAGGLVGRVDGGSVSDSHATATVTGSGSSLSIGGLFGKLDGGASVAGDNSSVSGRAVPLVGAGTCPVGACASKTETEVEISALLSGGIAGVKLSVPGNLQASVASSGDGNYTISWSAVSAAAGGYVLQESIDNGTNWTAVILTTDNATSHDFENKEGETNYKYRVRGCVATACIAGTSESSPWVNSPGNFVQVAYPAITSIALSETTDIDGAYSITWNKLGNASKYQIRKRSLTTPLATESTSDQYKNQQSSASQRLNQSGQLGHRSYGYKIRACNSQNICTSNWSREVTVEVTLPVVSGLRSDESTSYDREYRVSWDNIARDAGNRYGTNNANITYKLEEQTGASSSLAWTSFYNGSQSSKLITKSALSTYSYRVSSCSTVGCGPSTAGSAHVSVNVLGLLAPALSSVHNPVYIVKLEKGTILRKCHNPYFLF